MLRRLEPQAPPRLGQHLTPQHPPPRASPWLSRVRRPNTVPEKQGFSAVFFFHLYSTPALMDDKQILNSEWPLELLDQAEQAQVPHEPQLPQEQQQATLKASPC